MSELLWRPDPSVIANSNMTAFARYAAEETGIPFPDYQTLHRWSVDCLEDFWHLFLKFTDLTHDGNSHPVLSNLKMPGARWFENIRLNFAENIFAPNLAGVAIQFEIEEQAYSAAYTFDELRAEVARCAAGLQSVGIKEGDRVAGYMANVPEAVIACLACASIGAVWSSASPDFGLAALCDRLSQVAPRLVFASTHYRYAGKIFDTGKVVSALKNRISSLQTIVSVPILSRKEIWQATRVGARFSAQSTKRLLTLNGFRSPSRSSFSSLPGPLAHPNAWYTALAEPCCNIAKNTNYIATSNPATPCCFTPPAAG